MGDPKKQRKKYETPTHPWQKDRLEEEKKLVKEFGLKNKKEVWRVKSKLKHYGDLAKALGKSNDADAQQGIKDLVKGLYNLGVLSDGADLNNVLDLNIKGLLGRRLQTVVCRLGLAKSVKQARQFIVHGHVSIGDKKMTIPSYFVTREDEKIITFADNSALSNEDHPERVKEETAEPVEAPAEPAKDKKSDKKDKKESKKDPKKESKKEDKKEDKAEAKEKPSEAKK